MSKRTAYYLILLAVCALNGFGGIDPFAAPGTAASNKIIPFRVSQVGNDKSELLRIFKLIQDQDKKIPSTSFEVLQRLSPTEFLVYKLVTKESVVSSASASMGGGGNVYSHAYTEPDLSTVYCLKLTSPSNAVDGEEIKNLSVILTEEIKTYETALGAQRSVRTYVDHRSSKLSKEEFVIRLKSGEEWTLLDYSKEACFPCGGDGVLSDFKGGGKCKDCNGSGSFQIGLLVKW